jgi:hypothetical protein
MAATAKKPLVLDNSTGWPRELKADEYIIAPISDDGVINATNANASAITQGMVVYQTATPGSVDIARANAVGTTHGFGLVADASIAAAATGVIQFDGPFEMADWTTITGSASLTPGSRYYLSPSVAGKLVTSAALPVAAGSFEQEIGFALDAQTLMIRPRTPYQRN